MKKTATEKPRTNRTCAVILDPDTRIFYEEIAEAERRTLSNVLRNALQDHIAIIQGSKSSRNNGEICEASLS